MTKNIIPLFMRLQAASCKTAICAQMGKMVWALPLCLLAPPLCLLEMAAPPAAAQNLANSFSGFSAKKDEPVNIEADTLEVFDTKKVAYFRGNVKVTQGLLTMRSRVLEVTYTARDTNKDKKTGSKKNKKTKAEKSASPMSSSVKFIKAKGRVVIDTPDKQTVTSKWADFDVVAQHITIGGNVVMTQGKNLMKGDKLFIDLVKGTSRLETNAGPEVLDKKGVPIKKPRVQVMFMPSEAKNMKGLGGADKKKSKTTSKKKPAIAASTPARSAAARKKIDKATKKRLGDALGEP